MELLILACAVFLATHFVPSTPLRGALVRATGQWVYTGIYSLVAFATIGWMIWAYQRAPLVPLWTAQLPALRMLPAIVLPVSFILLACGLFARNPTIVGADKLLKSPEPARGMIRVTRHPLMWSFLLWALAHIAARGDLKSLIFFGSFALLAGVGTLLMDRRKQQTLGEDWARFAAVTSNLPFAAILQGRNRFDAKEIGWRNPLIGLALYALFFWLHPVLFGTRPW
jgi:uncharacterized membrane protein